MAGEGEESEREGGAIEVATAFFDPRGDDAMAIGSTNLGKDRRWNGQRISGCEPSSGLKMKKGSNVMKGEDIE